MGVVKNMDLIATIEDDAEVENLSEDSDAEVEVCSNILMAFKLICKTILFAVSTNEIKM